MFSLTYPRINHDRYTVTLRHGIVFYRYSNLFIRVGQSSIESINHHWTTEPFSRLRPYVLQYLTEAGR